jgi:hypothetical protein
MKLPNLNHSANDSLESIFLAARELNSFLARFAPHRPLVYREKEASVAPSHTSIEKISFLPPPHRDKLTPHRSTRMMSQEKIIQVKIFSEDNENLWWSVGCSEDEKVGVVKKRLIAGSGRYVARLFHMGVLLDDKRTLRQCGVNEKTILSTGRSASIIRGKTGSRGTPDWSPQAGSASHPQQQQAQHDDEPKTKPLWKTSVVVRHSHSDDLATRQTPKRSASGTSQAPRSKSASSNDKQHLNITAASVRPPEARKPSTGAASSNVGVDHLHYTLSREEEKLVLEHKIKQLEAQLAAKNEGTDDTSAAAQVRPSSAKEDVKRWPFRPFRIGIRTPALPLETGLFAKDPVTGTIAGALLAPTPSLAAVPQDPARTVSSCAPPLSATSNGVLAPQPMMTAPHAMLFDTQPTRPAGPTIYPDQGSLIAKPGFLGCPVQLFNSSVQQPSMTSV